MKWAAAVMCRRSGRYVARSIQVVNQAGVVGLAKAHDPDRAAVHARRAEEVGVGRLRAPGRLRHAERRELLRAPPRRARAVSVPAARAEHDRVSAALDPVLDLVRRLQAPGGQKATARDRSGGPPCRRGSSATVSPEPRAPRSLRPVASARECRRRPDGCRSDAPRRAAAAGPPPSSSRARTASPESHPRRCGTRPSAPRAARLPARARSPSASPCRRPARPRGDRTRHRARVHQAEAAARSRPRR